MKIKPGLVTPFLTLLFRFWTRLIRYDDRSEWKAISEAQRQGVPVVLALWHNELVGVTGFGYRTGDKYAAVVSQSRDGEFIARVLENLGLVTNRGSSSRGGLRALLGVAKEVGRNGRIGVFAVDGPRGPRHEVKDGVVFMAQHAQALLFPVRAFPEKKHVFRKSWDKFELPCPLTRCRIRVGAPLSIPDEKLIPEVLDRERERVRDALLALRPEWETDTDEP
ncbi:MAG: lysophospholipid acyltransferase family protein [Desulfovibrio sp.]